MKQLVLDISSGDTKVVEVPEPSIRTGGIVVKNHYSVISIGTEKNIVDFLKKEGAIIYGYDGVVKPEDIKGLGVERISQIYEKKNYDCIILMNNNQEFRGIDFKKLNEGSKPLLIIDGWYMYDSKILDRLGIKYFALGAKNE